MFSKFNIIRFFYKIKLLIFSGTHVQGNKKFVYRFMHFCNMNKLYKNQNWIKLSSLNIHDNNCIYIDDFLDFKGGILKRSKKSPFFSSTEFYIKSTPPPLNQVGP